MHSDTDNILSQQLALSVFESATSPITLKFLEEGSKTIQFSFVLSIWQF